MNRRQKIIVSVVGIFIVLLALVGITYGYFLTRIQGNTNTTSITVTTAKLELVYGDGNGEIIEGTGALIPTTGTETNDAIGTKTFTVTNNGNDTSYEVIIDNAVTKYANNGSYKKEDGTLVTYTKDQETEFISNDFRYTLTCRVKDKNGNVLNDEKCNEVEGLDIFPYKGGILVENDILENRVHEYTFTLWYIDNGKDQSEDMNKTYQARINIDAEAEDSFSILYSFGVLADTHITTTTRPNEDFQRALTYLKDSVDFTVVNGDFVSAATEEKLTTYKTIVDNYAGDMPVYEVYGNHESYMVDSGTSLHSSAPIQLLQEYTDSSLYYSFTRGDDVFIMVGDNTENGPNVFTTEEMLWLNETLNNNKNKRCFVFQHVPAKDDRTGWLSDSAGDGLPEDLGSIFVNSLKEHKNVTWFHAHTHASLQKGNTVLPKSYYGYNSVHVPSLTESRIPNTSSVYESEGYIVDVYNDRIIIKGIKFDAGDDNNQVEPFEEYIYEIDTTIESSGEFKGELIPEGCTYTTADGTVYTAGEYMPFISEPGDEFDDGEYIYKLDYRKNGSYEWVDDSYTLPFTWGVSVKNKTKEYYQPIPSHINNLKVTNISSCFKGCAALKATPELPNTIVNMMDAFISCSNIETVTNIPNNLKYMNNAFYNCTSLTGTITINCNPNHTGALYGTTKSIVLTGSSTVLDKIAQTANNGNVTVQ